jgi:hypothetical protein
VVAAVWGEAEGTQLGTRHVEEKEGGGSGDVTAEGGHVTALKPVEAGGSSNRL